MTFRCTMFALICTGTLAATLMAQDGPPSAMSRLVQESSRQASLTPDGPSVAATTSMFAIEKPKARGFSPHDLVTIVVRETTRVSKKNELESDKKWDLSGSVTRFPDMSIGDLLNLQLFGGRTTNMPRLDMSMDRSFSGEGEQKQEEAFTTRLQSEVIEVLPNGNLVLEARTTIIMDTEQTTMKVTGVCRPEDVTPVNTVQSGQIHDLHIERVTAGELRRSTEKGIIPKLFETLFSF